MIAPDIAESGPPVEGLGGLSPRALSRALELVAPRCGVDLEPEQAWLAASLSGGAEADEWPRSLIQSTRAAGLNARVELLGEGRDRARDLLELASLGGPALCCLQGIGGSGGRVLVLLGGDARAVEIAVLEAGGEEWRRRIQGRELEDWLHRHGGDERRWLRVESLLPLASLGRLRAGSPSQAALSPGRRAVARLGALAGLERRDLGVVAVYAVAVGGASLAVPVAVQALVNTVALGAALQPLVVLTLLMAGVLTFVAVLQVSQAVVVEMLQRRVFVRVATDFARRLPRLERAQGSKLHGPDLANRFFDAAALQKSGASLLLTGSGLLLQMLAGLLLLAFYHPLLLAFDFVLIASLCAVIFVLGRGAVEASLRESKGKYALAAWLEDVARDPGSLGDTAGRAFADARGDRLVRTWLEARGDHFRRLLRQLVGGVGLQVLASAALLGIGGWLVIQRQLTLGQLVAAEIVVTSIGAGLGKLGKQLESVYDAVTSAEKIGQIVDLPVERRGGVVLGGSGPIAARVFSAGEHALEEEGETFATLERGARAVWAGRSRAHTRLCDALYTLQGPTSGGPELAVELEGIAASLLDPERSRERLALAREPDLYGASLLDNLCLGRPIEQRAVWGALSLVGLNERIVSLGEGLELRLTAQGAPLDPIEQRRMSLARALLREPGLLLLDGALDGLDLGDAEFGALLDHVFDPAAPWTLLVISDDPRVLARGPQGQAQPGSSA